MNQDKSKEQIHQHPFIMNLFISRVRTIFIEGTNMDQHGPTLPNGAEENFGNVEDVLAIFQIMHWHIGTLAGVVGLAMAIMARVAVVTWHRVSQKSCCQNLSKLWHVKGFGRSFWMTKSRLLKRQR